MCRSVDIHEALQSRYFSSLVSSTLQPKHGPSKPEPSPNLSLTPTRPLTQTQTPLILHSHTADKGCLDNLTQSIISLLSFGFIPTSSDHNYLGACCRSATQP